MTKNIYKKMPIEKKESQKKKRIELRIYNNIEMKIFKLIKNVTYYSHKFAFAVQNYLL